MGAVDFSSIGEEREEEIQDFEVQEGEERCPECFMYHKGECL